MGCPRARLWGSGVRHAADDAADLFDTDGDPIAGHRFHHIKDLLGGPGRPQQPAERLLLVKEEETLTFNEVEPHECWRCGMLDKLA